MSGVPLELIDPSEALQAAYVEFVEDFHAADEAFAYAVMEEITGDFGAYVKRLCDHAEGHNMPAGYVPQNTYWLVRGGRILGTSSLRHRLNDRLMDYGGHIGYAVRPSERNKGHATRMLELTLERASERGLPRVRITCDQDNPASARVIQKCGGRLDSESFSEQAYRVTQRYWVDLAPDHSAADDDL